MPIFSMMLSVVLHPSNPFPPFLSLSLHLGLVRVLRPRACSNPLSMFGRCVLRAVRCSMCNGHVVQKIGQP